MSKLRDNECHLLLEWIKANISTTQPTPVRREDIAEQTSITIGNTQKGLKQLIDRGYLSYDARRIGPSYYQTVKDLAGLTGHQLSGWIKDYQSAVDRERHQNLKKAGETVVTDDAQQTPEAEPSLFAQPERLLTPSQQFPMTPQKPGPEAPKSRAQQLQDQLDQLAREIEAERQKEAAQAQKDAEQPGTLPELLSMLDTRIDGVERKFDALEKKVNVVLYFFQQASFAVRSLGPVSLPAEPISEPQPIAAPTPEPQAEPAAEPTTRNLLVRLVNSYAAADRKSEHDTWKWLYGQFDLRKGFNVYTQGGASAKGKDESYLAVVEQHGQIDALYKLAKKLMVLPELR